MADINDELETEVSAAAAQQDEAADVEVEILDDTPAADRGRAPLDREVADPSDDELKAYSAGVRQRVNELTHARHDERRAREAAQREQQEALRVAQQVLEENRKLREMVQQGGQIVASTQVEKAQAAVDEAKRKLAAAHEAFDTNAIVEAQEELTDAKMRMQQAKNFRPQVLTPQETVVQTPQVQHHPAAPDEKALRWQAKNQWFGTPGYEEMTNFALGVDTKLRSSGVDPHSDEYYARIDQRVRDKFPEVVGAAPATARKPSTVVASATRTSGAKKVQLTATQVALARKFGLTPQQYAAELVKMEQTNG
jgi:hypothetical protein